AVTSGSRRRHTPLARHATVGGHRCRVHRIHSLGGATGLAAGATGIPASHRKPRRPLSSGGESHRGAAAADTAQWSAGTAFLALWLRSVRLELVDRGGMVSMRATAGANDVCIHALGTRGAGRWGC